MDWNKCHRLASLSKSAVHLNICKSKIIPAGIRVQRPEIFMKNPQAKKYEFFSHLFTGRFGFLKLIIVN